MKLSVFYSKLLQFGGCGLAFWIGMQAFLSIEASSEGLPA